MTHYKINETWRHYAKWYKIYSKNKSPPVNCSIYELNFITGMYIKNKQTNTVLIGFGAISGFRHPLGEEGMS